MEKESKLCAYRNLTRELHLCRAISDRVFLVFVVLFQRVVIRDDETGRAMVSQRPGAHILNRFFRKDGVAGQDLYMRDAVTIGREFELDSALQVHRLGFWRVPRARERRHHGYSRVGLGKSAACEKTTGHDQEQRFPHAKLLAQRERDEK